MKVSNAYPSKYLRAADFPDDAHTPVVIDRVELGQMSESDPEDVKPIIYLRGYEKAFVCNKTNASVIAQRYGDEMDDWHGKPILIFVGTYTMDGRSGPCIRVKVPVGKAAIAAAPAYIQGRSAAPPDPTPAKKRAWADMQTKCPSLTRDQQVLALQAICTDKFPDTPPTHLTGTQWDSIADYIRNEYGNDAIPKAADGAMDDSQIPF